MNKKGEIIRRLLPFLGLILAFLTEVFIPNHKRHPAANHNYYAILLVIIAIVFIVLNIFAVWSKRIRQSLVKTGAFYFGVAVFFTILNFITAKKLLVPALLFPSFDNVLSVFVESRSLVVKCIFYSFRLLLVGVFWGILFGFITGLALGFSKKVYYWLNPVIKIIGPIPATAWIPIALTTFATTFQASAFIIALAVWFPVVLMTSSGIQNISNVYFEVGKTLGTNKLDQVFRIGIPAALPSIFQGIFYGVCSAFIALMTGEMFGARAGIGWFISMEKEMAEYKGVYAGLIMIALFCSLILTLVFKARAKLLAWQRGLIKW